MTITPQEIKALGNGGPADFLSWIIETKDNDFTPDHLAEWLEGRLPNPVDDLTGWNSDE